jgi:hypothetical protein
LTTLLRVLAGTAIYVLVIVLAAPFPSAAGMMLVFPTLNGLAYVFSDRGRVLAMVPSMLWMPVVNGALCAAYLLTFRALAPSVPSVPLAWGLTATAIVLFILLVVHPRVRRGIAPEHQLAFAVFATIVGAALVVAAALAAGGAGPSDAASAQAMSWASAGDAVGRNAGKVAVFALCLAAFLVATRLLPLSDGVRGILAGLPFAPFAGLVSIAGDGALDLGIRLDIVRQMAVSIWLGPAIAIWFIYAFPRVLVGLAPGSARAVPALIAAWGACGLAVAVATALLRTYVVG